LVGREGVPSNFRVPISGQLLYPAAEGDEMDKVDQFESLFKSAARARFERTDVRVTSVMVVADGDAEAVAPYAAAIRGCLGVLGSNVRWSEVSSTAFQTIEDLLTKVESEAPDLICTHRHVGSPHRQWEFTLGEVLDVLTQAVEPPVMVMPAPGSDEMAALGERNGGAVLVMTDHLTGDGKLINHALRFTSPDDRLVLCHVEDDAVFARYLDAVAKIPELDTDFTGEALRERLLKDPRDYAGSCAEILREDGVPVTVETDIRFGHRLDTWREIIKTHDASLLVMNTKDEDQDAMHGLAHPIAVEMRDVPLLML